MMIRPLHFQPSSSPIPPRTAIAQAALGAELLTLDPAPLADIGVMS